jgi:hypothetical protein
MKLNKQSKSKVFQGLFLFFLGFCLLYAMSSLWLQRVVYAPNSLSEITAEAFMEESSRKSVANTITGKIFEDRPVLESTVGPRVSTLLAGALGSDIAANSVQNIVERFRESLVGENSALVAINLVPLKETISQVQTLAGRDQSTVVTTEKIPDDITLLDTSSLRPYYEVGVYVVWMGPLALLTSISGLFWWVYKDRKTQLALRLRQVGLVVLVTGFFAYLLGPISQPAFIAIAANADAQTLLSNIHAALLAPFSEIAVGVFLIGIVVLVSSFIPVEKLPTTMKRPLKSK